MPIFQQAAYGGETLVLENGKVRMEIHKRLTGWGWAEVFDSQGTCMGVLEHFGELMVRDMEMPMRLEATSYERSQLPGEERIVLQVKALVVQQHLKGTSFDTWIQYPFHEPLMDGEVSLSLKADEPVIKLNYTFTSRFNLFARYVRGPWLKVGAGSFGQAKADAILPGIEWLQGEEWSSGTDWFKDPWALRAVPHPNQVAVPMMAVSTGSTAISLSWNANLQATRWFNYRPHLQQPVFASPNFIDRMNNHLLGLMVPDARGENAENQVYANPPLELHPGQQLAWEAAITLTEGVSLDAVSDWVARHGLPEPAVPRWSYDDALRRIADAYNNRFWHEGKGFGTMQNPDSIHPYTPRFSNFFIKRFAGEEAAEQLKQKVAWCASQQPPAASEEEQQAAALAKGLAMLEYQRQDGSFAFEPDGRHYMKDDFVVARAFLEPMGLAGDTALDMCMVPAISLLQQWKATGDQRLLDGALRALDFCLEMARPEGGDFWETPLHSPNLLAAGHAAIAYELAYSATNDARYRERAVYWIRALLPFTHLWQPEGHTMQYYTKPCFCSSDWYFANWVRDHVQWEVLETFAQSYLLHIDWAAIDEEIDWRRYQEGITNAALWWMIDHSEQRWMPHNLPHTKPIYDQGLLDDCFADTHNSTTGLYGGMAIMPDAIAVNLHAVLDGKK